MSCYVVQKQQNDDTSVFLRIMLYSSYILNFRMLQNRFTSNSEMFFYLILKYRFRFKELSNLKNSSKKKYQEVTWEYENIGIRVSPAVHQILKNLSDVTGYSISAIVRFLIEWECFGYVSENLKEKLSGENLDFNFQDPFEIVITELEIHHRYLIENEKVEEDFILRTS